MTSVDRKAAETREGGPVPREGGAEPRGTGGAQGEVEPFLCVRIRRREAMDARAIVELLVREGWGNQPSFCMRKALRKAEAWLARAPEEKP